MHDSGMMALAAAFALVACGAYAEGATAAATVCLAPEDSLLWKTAESPIAVDLTWPQGATSAIVEARDEKGVVASATVTDTASMNALLDTAAPATEADERVLALTLEFRDSSGAVIETHSARVGLVRGVDGAAARYSAAEEGTRAWQRTADPTAVIPVYGATTFDGVSAAGVTPPDWLFLHVSSGTHHLAATVGGESDEAVIWRPPFCTTIYLR